MPFKIVSLLPSATEIICALGLEDHLVGRSHECDFPLSVQQLPVCTSANLDPNASSAEIDVQVKDTLAKALSIYSIDKNLIKALSPDMIVTQAQCEVCAVTLENVKESLQDLLQKDSELISLSPGNLEDIFLDIQLLANKLGVDKGEKLL